MENGILVAVSHQAAMQRRLAVIANNLANLDTHGFRRSDLMFVQHLAAKTDGLAVKSDPPPVFVRDLASRRDPAQGRLEPTGNPFDVALRGEGYLVVQSEVGERYTRNGRLRLDDGGQLVSEHGYPVLSADGRPIVLTQEDTSIAIARDGTISSESGDLGRLRVVRFADDNRLQAVSGALYAAEDQQPEDVASPTIVQGMLEASNVQPILELEAMIRVQRAYEQTSSLIDREDARIRKMIDAYSV